MKENLLEVITWRLTEIQGTHMSPEQTNLGQMDPNLDVKIPELFVNCVLAGEDKEKNLLKFWLCLT